MTDEAGRAELPSAVSDRCYRANELCAMRDAGLQAAYLWACWGSDRAGAGALRRRRLRRTHRPREAGPPAGDHHTIAEIQPFWIHREIPDRTWSTIWAGGSSRRRGVNAPSGSPRADALTTSRCTRRWAASERHRRALCRRGAPVRVGPLERDCWAVHADGDVCDCDHTAGGVSSLARTAPRRPRRVERGLAPARHLLGRRVPRQAAGADLHRDARVPGVPQRTLRGSHGLLARHRPRRRPEEPDRRRCRQSATYPACTSSSRSSRAGTTGISPM